MELPIKDKAEMDAIVSFATARKLSFDQAYFQLKREHLKDMRLRYQKDKGMRKEIKKCVQVLAQFQKAYEEDRKGYY
jgi:hypothetical protein